MAMVIPGMQLYSTYVYISFQSHHRVRREFYYGVRFVEERFVQKCRAFKFR